ncbi:hypothetical protein ABZ565_31755 [Streptomyces sp. NPDC016469]|uniref:hypothetical protein n=1 Tax=Streptomyces sp. NPDC016469 TaxID=3157191 RepID=UPI0033F2A9A7
MDPHPTHCDRCKARALAAELLARSIRDHARLQDQQQHPGQSEAVADRKLGRWLSRRRI